LYTKVQELLIIAFTSLLWHKDFKRTCFCTLGCFVSVVALECLNLTV